MPSLLLKVTSVSFKGSALNWINFVPFQQDWQPSSFAPQSPKGRSHSISFDHQSNIFGGSDFNGGGNSAEDEKIEELIRALPDGSGMRGQDHQVLLIFWPRWRCSSVGRASFKGPSLMQLYWRGFESRPRYKVVGKRLWEIILAAPSGKNLR